MLDNINLFIALWYVLSYKYRRCQLGRLISQKPVKSDMKRPIFGSLLS